MFNTVARLGSFLADYLLMFGLSAWSGLPWVWFRSLLDGPLGGLDFLKSPFVSRMIYGYILFIVWRLIFALLGTLTPFQWLFGLRISRGQKSSGKAILRVITGEFTRPLLLLHLPLLYSRGSFAEWLSRQKINVQGFLWPMKGFVVLIIMLVWGILSPLVFSPDFPSSFLSVEKEEIHNDKLGNNKSFDDFQIISSRAMDLSLVTDFADGRFELYPQVEFVQDKSNGFWRGGLLIHDKKTGSSGSLVLYHAPEWKRMIMMAAKREQFFFRFYPELENNESPTPEQIEDLLYQSLAISPWFVFSRFLQGGIEHEGHLDIKHELEDFFGLENPEWLKRETWKDISFLTLVDKSREEVFFIALNGAEHHYWKIRFPGGRSSVGPFIQTFFTGAQWMENKTSPISWDDKPGAAWAFAFLDYFMDFLGKADGQRDQSMEKYLYHSYFQRGRELMEAQEPERIASFIKSLESVREWLKARDYDDSFLVTLQGMSMAAKKMNRDFFK